MPCNSNSLALNKGVHSRAAEGAAVLSGIVHFRPTCAKNLKVSGQMEAAKITIMK